MSTVNAVYLLLLTALVVAVLLSAFFGLGLAVAWLHDRWASRGARDGRVF